MSVNIFIQSVVTPRPLLSITWSLNSGMSWCHYFPMKIRRHLGDSVLSLCTWQCKEPACCEKIITNQGSARLRYVSGQYLLCTKSGINTQLPCQVNSWGYSYPERYFYGQLTSVWHKCGAFLRQWITRRCWYMTPTM